MTQCFVRCVVIVCLGARTAEVKLGSTSWAVYRLLRKENALWELYTKCPLVIFTTFDICIWYVEVAGLGGAACHRSSCPIYLDKLCKQILFESFWLHAWAAYCKCGRMHVSTTWQRGRKARQGKQVNYTQVVCQMHSTKREGVSPGLYSTYSHI